MARPVEFDRSEALRDAMEIFWSHGYYTTSIKDIVEATHIQPGSIYWAFGNKQKLFLEVLDSYCNDIQHILDVTLKTNLQPLERIGNFFKGLAQHTLNNESKKGCLLVNTLLEVSGRDQEISDRVDSMFARIETELCRVLVEAQVCGEITEDRNPENLAKLFITLIYGLRVYSKVSPDRKILEIMVEEFIRSITRPI